MYIYNTHGHKLRFPPFEKAQFVTECGIELAKHIAALICGFHGMRLLIEGGITHISLLFLISSWTERFNNLLDTITLERAGHAVTTTASLAQLKTCNIDHFHTGLTHLGNGVGIALVGHHDARLQGDGVIGIVPLLALGLVLVSTGFHDVEFRNLERIGDCVDEAGFLGHMEVAGLLAGPQAEGTNIVDDTWKCSSFVSVQQREDRVEVHVGAILGHDRYDHTLGGTLFE
jgi:hypothetical protein